LSVCSPHSRFLPRKRLADSGVRRAVKKPVCLSGETTRALYCAPLLTGGGRGREHPLNANP